MPKPKGSTPKPDDFNDDLAGGFDEENDLFTAVKSLPTVKSPSGAEVQVMNDKEVEFYNSISERYQEDNKFTNVSDLAELDRLLTYEMSCFRWANWLLVGADYDGNPVMSSLSKDIQAYSKEVRDIKGGLGIDKKTRDRDKGASTAEFMEKLITRAGEFGIHRDEQVIAAHTMLKELQALRTLHLNSTATERTEFKCHESDIFEWMDAKFKEFDALDEAFMKNQKIWVRELNE